MNRSLTQIGRPRRLASYGVAPKIPTAVAPAQVGRGAPPPAAPRSTPTRTLPSKGGAPSGFTVPAHRVEVPRGQGLEAFSPLTKFASDTLSKVLGNGSSKASRGKPRTPGGYRYDPTLDPRVLTDPKRSRPGSATNGKPAPGVATLPPAPVSTAPGPGETDHYRPPDSSRFPWLLAALVVGGILLTR